MNPRRCPVCRQDTDLTPAGNYALHRIDGKDRWTFCPMSGEPVVHASEVA